MTEIILKNITGASETVTSQAEITKIMLALQHFAQALLAAFEQKGQFSAENKSRCEILIEIWNGNCNQIDIFNKALDAEEDKAFQAAITAIAEAPI